MVGGAAQVIGGADRLGSVAGSAPRRAAEPGRRPPSRAAEPATEPSRSAPLITCAAPPTTARRTTLSHWESAEDTGASSSREPQTRERAQTAATRSASKQTLDTGAASKGAFLWWGVWLSVSHAIQTIHPLVTRCAYRIVDDRARQRDLWGWKVSFPESSFKSANRN